MFVCDKILTLEEIEYILSRGRDIKVIFKVGDLEFGKYCIELANRIKVPVYLEINEKTLYFELFRYWLTRKHIREKVEPFWSRLQEYIKQATGITSCVGNCVPEQVVTEPVSREEVFEYVGETLESLLRHF